MKKVLITQSNYIPWKGYFDAINMADAFIVYDDMQYTKNDWRNRNIIKTSNGLQWLTIPIEISGKHFHKINEMQVSEKHANWNKKHWQTIYHTYCKTPFFKDYKDQFEKMYLECNENNLSKINLHFLNSICQMLDINTTFYTSDKFELKGDRTEKLLNICLELGASHYLSGPAAKVYLDEKLFQDHNITVEWLDYSKYPEYNQPFPPFNHGVSVIDLIFNCGGDYKNFMRSF